MWLGGKTEGYRSLRFQEANWNWVDGSPFNYSNFPHSGMSRQSGNVLTFVNSIDSCPAQGCWKMQDKSQSSSLQAVCQGMSHNFFSFTISDGIPKLHGKLTLMQCR